MYEFVQQPAARLIRVSTHGLYVIIQIEVNDVTRGQVTIRLSASQARELAAGCGIEMLQIVDNAPTPKGPFVELWYTALPDGNSYVTMSYRQTEDAEEARLGMLLSCQDHADWVSALQISADRVDG